MKFLRSEEYRVMPWKNGGGTTREIALFVDVDRHPDFLWRLAIATIAKNGPFSRFEGIDRTIAVLNGEGMTLASPEGSVTVVNGGTPYPFDGETPIEAFLTNGETTDLNVMSRRGYFTHSVERHSIRQPLNFRADAEETIIVFNGNVTVETQNETYLAQPLDAIVAIERGVHIILVPEVETEVFIIRLAQSTPQRSTAS